MQTIAIFGAGGHAKAVIDVIEKEGLYRIVGLLDSHKPPGTEVYGYTVLGNESYIAEDSSIKGIHVAIGDSWIRGQIAAAIRSLHPDLPFVTAIHPNAAIARGAVVGEGSVLMAGAVVNSDTRLGNHCVLYTHSSVDHDSTLGDFVTIAPHAATGGNVHIGSYSTLSMGVSVIHSITIGEHTVIGAGSTVLSAIGSYSIAYGTPARIIRKRVAGERYL